jgi:hypothetical protein
MQADRRNLPFVKVSAVAIDPGSESSAGRLIPTFRSNAALLARGETIQHV